MSTRTAEAPPRSPRPADPGDGARRGGLPWRRVRPIQLTQVSRARKEPQLGPPVVAYGPWFDTIFQGAQPAGQIRLVVRAATLRGRMHAHKGHPAQDAVGVVWNGRRQALFTVAADGLGSLPDSGEVAREAVDRALHRCRTLPPDGSP